EREPVPQNEPEPVPAPQPEARPAPQPRPRAGRTQPPARPERVIPPALRAPRSEAYEALATLGRTDPRMALSATECADLENLAADWLACGTGTHHLIQALTTGLPPTVHCPGALARTRLIHRMPPAPAAPATQQYAAVPRRIMECTGCGAPGRPDALPGGLCRTCRIHRGHIAPPHPADEPDTPTPAEIHARVNHLRQLRAPRTPATSNA
ncbi:MarR family transcriptional regulator, partial [Streptomyces sp. H27-D2]|nr:MarR family transcriptional regulator [Streptomyces sp. H27-D2]